jgi:hypothetical protein
MDPQGTPASPDPAIMGGNSGAPSSKSSAGGSGELAYLKKLAADLQAKIESLEHQGASKISHGVDAVKSTVGSAVDSVKEATASVTGGSGSPYLGVILMGPPGAGKLLAFRSHL